MDVLDTLKVLLRRWWVVLPVLLLTGVGAFAVASSVPPVYTATGTAILVTDPQLSGINNPSVLAEIVEDGEVRAEIEAAGFGAHYEVHVGDDGIIRVYATATDEPEATATVETVLERLGTTLEHEQAATGQPQRQRATVEILNHPLVARPLPTTVEGAPTAYEAIGSARLLDPVGAARSDTTFTFLGIRNLMIDYLLSDAAREAIAPAGSGIEYELRTSEQAPVFIITAMAHDPATAVAGVERIVGRTGPALEYLREVAVAGDLTGIAVEPFVMPEHANVDSLGKIRILIALLAMGGIAAVGLALAVESIAQARVRRRPTMTEHRRSRRRARAGDDPAGPGTRDPAQQDPAPEPDTTQEVPVAARSA